MDNDTRNWIIGISVFLFIFLGWRYINAWSQNSKLKKTNELLVSQVDGLEDDKKTLSDNLYTITSEVKELKTTWYPTCNDLRTKVDSIDTSY